MNKPGMMASTGKFTTMLAIMMRHVSSHSLMTSRMEDFTMDNAGPGGNALGSSAHLKTKTVAATSAGRKTAGKTVALKR